MGLIGAWLGSLYFGVPAGPHARRSLPGAARRAGCGRSTATAARSRRRRTSPTSCARSRIDDEELEGLDLVVLAPRAQRRRAGEPGDARALRASASRACGFRPEAMMPVYGLAECSVGARLPAARPRAAHRPRRPRAPSSATAGAPAGARTTPTRSRFVALRAPAPRPRDAHRRRARARAAGAPRGGSSSADRRRRAATSATRGDARELLDGRLARLGRPRLPRRRRGLRHRPRQGHHHPRRPQPLSRRSSRRRSATPGRPQGLRRRVRRAPTRRPAPSGWWCVAETRADRRRRRRRAAARASTSARWPRSARRRTTSYWCRRAPCRRPRAARSAAAASRELYARGTAQTDAHSAGVALSARGSYARANSMLGLAALALVQRGRRSSLYESPTFWDSPALWALAGTLPAAALPRGLALARVAF